MTDNCTAEKSSTAFAFSLIPIVRILTIHVILKVFLPLFAFCIYWKCNIFWSIDRRSVTRQTLMLIALLQKSLSAVLGVGCCFLVKGLCFISAMRDKRIGQSVPLFLDLNCKCRACIILMSVRKIAKDFQRYLHLIVAVRKHILPYSKRRIVYSSVNDFKGVGTDRRLVILCDSHNLFVDSVNLRRFCCRLSECLYFSDFSL